MSEPPQSSESMHDTVLNAIDIISYRKNRPNIARIYRHLVRFYNISSATCEKLLEELVEQGRVIKVTYKGNISYRNAAKWKHINRYQNKEAGGSNVSSRRASSILSGTIAELVVRIPSYFRNGVPCKVLEDHLLAKDGRFTKESIHKLLQKELQQETLVQLDNGNYFLSIENNSTTNSTSSESDSNNVQEISDIKNTNNNDTNVVDLIEEIDDTVVVEDGNVEQDDDDVDDGEEDDEEELEEEEEEGENVEEDAAKTDAESTFKRRKNRAIELSGESEEESIGNDSFLKEDSEYRPPRKISVNTRRNSSGRLSVRNKRTRYDASEYVFPSLKRSYKIRQDKNAAAKLQNPKRTDKIVLFKDLPKPVLDAIAATSTSTTSPCTSSPPTVSITITANGSNYTSRSTIRSSSSMSSILHKSRISPNVLLKHVQLNSSEDSNKNNNLYCFICNDSFNLLNVANSTTSKCKICSKKAHPACVEKEQANGKLQVDSTSWACEVCRYIIAQPCSVCHQKLSKMGPLIICGKCKLSYHRTCHKPPITNEETLVGSWSCSECPSGNKEHTIEKERILDHKMPPGLTITPTNVNSQKIEEKNVLQDAKIEEDYVDIDAFQDSTDKNMILVNNTLPLLREKQVEIMQINDSTAATRPQQQQQNLSSQSLSPTTSSSPPSSQFTEENIKVDRESDDCLTSNKLFKEEVHTENIPDSSDWTPTDVYKYFKDTFNDQVAVAFLKQEIDGHSLMLLRRSDVLRGLGFKLGVGLNVLYHVKMLQNRTHDLKVIWAAE